MAKSKKARSTHSSDLSKVITAQIVASASTPAGSVSASNVISKGAHLPKKTTIPRKVKP